MAMRTLAILIAALLAAPLAAEDILRPRDKAAFEAELKALQEKYGGPPPAAGEPPIEVSDSGAHDEPAAAQVELEQAPVTESAAAADATETEATAEAAGQPAKANSVAAANPSAPPAMAGTEAAQTTATEAAAAAAEPPSPANPVAERRQATTDPVAAEPQPMFPGTLLRPRSAASGQPAQAGTMATGTATPANEAKADQARVIESAPASTAQAEVRSDASAFPGTTLSPRGKPAADARGAIVLQAPESDSTPAQPVAEPQPPALFEGTTLSPRGPEAAARVLTTPGQSPADPDALPTRRLTPGSGNAQPAVEAGLNTLRIALLPVGQHQFEFREQIYDAESLEIYLRQLGQPIDSVVLLSEAGRSIELGHLVALGRLGRVLRVPTLYQQGERLRALSIR